MMADLPTSREAILRAYPKITSWVRTLSRNNALALEIATMMQAISRANTRANIAQREVARLQRELAYITALACTCNDSRYKRCSVHPTITNHQKEPART